MFGSSDKNRCTTTGVVRGTRSHRLKGLEWVDDNSAAWDVDLFHYNVFIKFLVNSQFSIEKLTRQNKLLIRAGLFHLLLNVFFLLDAR